MHRHHFPGLAALRRDLANSTAEAFGSRASMDCARKPYSREIDMHARLNTSRTASDGVGIVGRVMNFLRLLVAVPAASRAVSAADSPVTGGAVPRAQHQA